MSDQIMQQQQTDAAPDSGANAVLDELMAQAPAGYSREELVELAGIETAPEPEGEQHAPEEPESEQAPEQKQEEHHEERESRVVPLAALKEEREKRKELQRRLDEIERQRQQQAPPAQTQPTGQREAMRAVAQWGRNQAAAMLGIDPSEFDPFDPEHATAYQTAVAGSTAALAMQQAEQQRQAQEHYRRAQDLNQMTAEVEAEVGDATAFVAWARDNFLPTLPYREGRELELAVMNQDAATIKKHLSKAMPLYKQAVGMVPPPAQTQPQQPQKLPPRSSMAGGAPAPGQIDIDSMSPAEFNKLPAATQRKLLGG